MKLRLVDIKNNSKGERDLPVHFSEAIRPDLVKRAFLAFMSRSRRYGSKPRAGMDVSANLRRRRNVYRTGYGYGISRVPRKILSRRGERFNWVGAFVSGVVSGRRAHPPKAEKVWFQKLNKKERRKAVRSAMAATVDRSLVVNRGHRVPKEYPFIVDSAFENIKTTKELRSALIFLGFEDELGRGQIKKVRAGIGTMRGRKYKRKVSLLIVVSKECSALKAARNLPGVSVVTVLELNASLLAPGSLMGRATLWTEDALSVLEKEGLFL